MKKVTLYSRSSRNGRPGSTADDRRASPPVPSEPEPPETRRAPSARSRMAEAPEAPGNVPPVGATTAAPAKAAGRARWWRRGQNWLAGFATVMTLAVICGGIYIARLPAARQLTQKDIDSAVMNTLTTKQLPSQAARSYAAIRPSVVRIRGLGHDDKSNEDIEQSVGSGVVIVDSGMILTNLHVVSGAEKLKVVFFDGTESDAFVVSTQPENDLAVVQAKTLPDDLTAATLRSTKDLMPGDEVIAVGFPFGIGPSVSSGIVSGLHREYRSQDGKRQLTNLIQFDAAANPGSSGGPLVTTDGAVVGIVTGILNRGDQRVFIGIGFAVPIENAAAGIGLAPF